MKRNRRRKKKERGKQERLYGCEIEWAGFVDCFNTAGKVESLKPVKTEMSKTDTEKPEGWRDGGERGRGEKNRRDSTRKKRNSKRESTGI